MTNNNDIQSAIANEIRELVNYTLRKNGVNVDPEQISSIVGEYLDEHGINISASDITGIDTLINNSVSDYFVANPLPERLTEEELASAIQSYFVQNPIDTVTDEELAAAVSTGITDYFVQNPVDTVTDEELATAVSDYFVQNPVDTVTDEELATAVSDYFVQNPVDTVTDEELATAVSDYFVQNPVDTVTDEELATAVSDYFVQNPVDTVTDEELESAINSYFVQNPVDTVTDEELASAIQAYFVQNPVEGTVTEDDLKSAITDYFVQNPVDTVTDEELETAIQDFFIKNPLDEELATGISSGISNYFVQNPIENYDDSTVKGMIGDLTKLETTDKTSAVNAINELKKSVADGKTLVANAISDKGVSTATDAAFSVMANNISSIIVGDDITEATSDATATASHILEGYTAYVNGEKRIGTMPNNENWNCDATKEPIHIPKGYHDGLGVVDGTNVYNEGVTDGHATGKTEYEPKSVIVSSSGDITISNAAGETVLSSTTENNYNAGVEFADGRINSESASYSSGYSAGNTDGQSTAKTAYEPKSVTATNAGNVTVKNIGGDTVLSSTITNSYDAGYEAGDSAGQASSKTAYEPKSVTATNAGSVTVKNEAGESVLSTAIENSYDAGVTYADGRINTDSASYEAGLQNGGSGSSPSTSTLSDDGLLSVKNSNDEEIYSETFDNSYNAGVSYADGRANTSSTNYKTGYNAGVTYADGRANTSSTNYKTGYSAGVTYADGRANTSSTNYKTGYNAGVTYADGRANTSSTNYITGYNAAKTDYNPTDATLGNDGELTVKNSDGTSRLTKTFTNSYDAGVSYADGRANTSSTNYKTGYNAGVTDTKKGTAAASDVLTGKTFTNSSSVGASGSMANKGDTTLDAGSVTSDSSYTYLGIPANGYYNTSSKLRTPNSNLSAFNRVANVDDYYSGATNISSMVRTFTVPSGITKAIMFIEFSKQGQFVGVASITGNGVKNLTSLIDGSQLELYGTMQKPYLYLCDLVSGQTVTVTASSFGTNNNMYSRIRLIY